jgi:uncharacterized membrane protein YeaQ/YmgE (transglycosylase-associated protein family)
MGIFSFLALLFIAAVCGAIGQAIAGYSMGGCLVSTAIGFIGAILGTWIARTANLPLFFTIQIQGEAFPVIWAILGSAIFVMVIGLITRGRAR